MIYDKSTIVFQPKPTHKRFTDIDGEVFNRLTVLGFAELNRRSFWWCECICGNIVRPSIEDLRSRKVQSCGCLHLETGKNNRTHGLSNSRTYRSWNMMLQRCNNPTMESYKYYGEKGITVYKQWYKFDAFLADMGERPTGTSLERRDNNGNYEPSNCYWGTPIQQANNKGNNHLITYNNCTQTLQMWARELNCHHTTILQRLKYGWGIEKTLSTPIRSHSHRTSSL